MKLVFATHNQNKFKEVAGLLPGHIELLSLSDIGCNDDIPETADTIEGNAALKASYVKNNYGLDCFADDTGLEIKALNGAPGVYSARYAGPKGNAEANIIKVLQELKGVTDRAARFKTAIVLNIGGSEKNFIGICKGVITETPTGSGGFGYDPIFLPEGRTQTFAEMYLAEKNEIGHRGKAIKELIRYLSR